MNSLAHVRMNLDLLDVYGIKEQRNHILLGGILPDLSELGIIPLKPAHEHSLSFIEYLRNHDPQMVGLGFGFMLHGEDPCGLDHYTHREGGFIDANEMGMFEILQLHKPRLDPAKAKAFIHTMTEFAVDSHVDIKYAEALNNAVRRSDLDRIAFHIYNFYGGSPKKIRHALHFMRTIDWRKLTDVRKVAKYWKNYMAFQALAHGNYVKNYVFFTKTIALTRTGTLINMLKDARDEIEEPYAKFYDTTRPLLSKTFFEPFDSGNLKAIFAHQER
ncbi:hypothetical protein HY641_02120 [Candidatus Woesearchaeota archaeon]|nr:hypothetical protein [Candidatus Woesearchaeota archaeon]